MDVRTHGHPDGYELIRKEFNAQTLDTTERASAFLYLNRHCFNGLMRYNLAHQFNVGWENTRRRTSRSMS